MWTGYKWEKKKWCEIHWFISTAHLKNSCQSSGLPGWHRRPPGLPEPSPLQVIGIKIDETRPPTGAKGPAARSGLMHHLNKNTRIMMSERCALKTGLGVYSWCHILFSHLGFRVLVVFLVCVLYNEASFLGSVCLSPSQPENLINCCWLRSEGKEVSRGRRWMSSWERADE